MTLCKTASSQAAATDAEKDHDLRDRALKLLRTEIPFVPSCEFQSLEPTRDENLCQPLSESSEAPSDLPAHLRRMCSKALLTQEQERAFFREMNYLKFRANAWRARIDPDSIDPQMIERIEGLLRQAQAIRDHLIQSNMRLVMSIVKKFVTPQTSFDDLLSDGIMTLMQAVEKFDYSRGFRFSTYAYRSIARNAYRTVKAAHNEESRVTRDAEQWAFEEEGHRSSTLTDQTWENLRQLMASMLSQLDRRERLIIRSRYALGAHRKVRTFQDIAHRLGVSKERVRQLEQRAVSKLRAMAAHLEMDDWFAAAMV